MGIFDFMLNRDQFALDKLNRQVKELEAKKTLLESLKAKEEQKLKLESQIERLRNGVQTQIPERTSEQSSAQPAAGSGLPSTNPTSSARGKPRKPNAPTKVT